MKIAYLVNTYPRPSHSFIRREILALERLGWQVQRFAMRSDREALVDPGDRAEDARTEHVLEAGAAALLRGVGWMLARPQPTFAALRQVWRLGARGRAGESGTGGRFRHLIYLLEAAYVARRCEALGITHLHAHFGTNSTTVALLSQALGGPGFSFTVHGPEEFDAPRAIALDEKIAASRFVVAVSSFGRSQLYRWCALTDWPKVQVVHCGIEVARFDAPAPMPQGGPHLVAIGRLSEQKGFPLLIEAMALAAPQLPGLRLTIVGDGELRGSIETAIARHGLGDVVHLAGWQDEAGVRAAIAGAQALILPSFAEGLPMVVMEAMASARPCIATSINGVPELVRSDCGWLVPAGDPSALSEAVVALSRTPPQTLAAMGSKARARALERHDVETEAAKLDALFRKALAV